MIESTRYYAIYRKVAALIEEGRNIERDYSPEWEYAHMSSAAQIGRILALRRGVDPEIAAVACLLHDIGRIVTGRQHEHAANGAAPARSVLEGFFPPSTIEEIVTAVVHHGRKDEAGTPIEEIVKDADVLDCALYGLRFEKEGFRLRLEKLSEEFGISSL